MHLFPESGFDQSATTPVFLGVLVAWLFTETLGWTQGGLVVPGYLATLFLLEPRSAAIDVGEACLTFAVARSLGEYLPYTGLTSRFFGRERFLLIVAVSVLVRLAIEGGVFPSLFPHAAWAYSIGLVVVPLMANACWKTGLPRGIVQNGVPTAIVYALLRYVLVPHTNLSLAGFHLATENIAASFLSSPKAYILLLTGAVLAAFANVRWGWDYGGILVPALLALVLCTPVKFVATLAEVVVLVGVVRALLVVTPARRWNIEGPRRPLLFFTVDYALRFAFAAAVGRFSPGTSVVDVTGFGYLLPTLLAVKVSQKGSAAIVILPTVSVSAAAFGLGSLLGFAADRLDAFSPSEREAVAREVGRAPGDPASAVLWLSALALPAAPHESPRGAALPAETWARLVDARLADDRAPMPASVEAQRLDENVSLIRERFENPDHRSGDPAVVARREAPFGPRIVAFVPAPLGAPESAALAGHLLAVHAVDVVVVAGVDEQGARSGDATRRALAVARALADAQAGPGRRGGFVVALRRSSAGEWRATLAGRAAAAPRVVELLKALEGPGSDIPREVGAGRKGEDVAIEAPPSGADTWLGEAPAPSLASTTAVMMAFGELHPSSTPPAAEELLALRRLLLEPLLDSRHDVRSLPLMASAATMLGYEFFGPSNLADGGEAFGLRPGPAGGGLALLVRRQGARGLVVEAQSDTSEPIRRLALRLAADLGADAVLMDLDRRRKVLESGAFSEAHAAAIWPRPGRTARLLVIHDGTAATLGEAVATTATWGGSEALALGSRTDVALERLGIPSMHGPLNLAVREQAGRRVFGATPLVAVAVGPQVLRLSALASPESALSAFATLPVLDEETPAVAAKLGGSLGRGAAAPDSLLDTARRAAVERSVVARRALEDALATTTSAAAIARASTGIYLVVVARSGRVLVAGAFPLALTVSRIAGVATPAASLAGCDAALAAGGTCRVMAP